MNTIVHQNGAFSVNTYCIIESSHALIIDPGSESEPLIEYLQKENIIPEGILITHPHIDHVEGLTLVQKAFPGVRTYLSADGKPELQHITEQAQLFGLPEPGPVIITDYILSEMEITVGPFTVMPLFTPGHCNGSLTFLINGMLFTGDALFKGTIGRTDLPGGDHTLLITSITDKIMTFDDNTQVYPGHGESTTIGYERKRNPFLRGFKLTTSED
jgi:glyoxylase-like metal-dependent hydrolase (beta-lactamase superfamily II)